MNDSGLVRLERLSTEEITGTEDGPGVIERYLTLSADGSVMLQDMQLNPDEMRIGNKRLCLLIPFPTSTTCRAGYGPTDAMSVFPRTARTAA